MRKTSTLHKYKADPKHAIGIAFNMFKSRKIKTAIVEGVCDKRFLLQWLKKDNGIRFDGFCGKNLVEEIFNESQKNPFIGHGFLLLVADVDFDLISGKPLIKDKNFIYNSYCFDTNNLMHNDLETFLINTTALEKILANYDIDPVDADSIRDRLEKSSRIIGSYRAADILLQKKEMLCSSILNGIELSGFFDPNNISIDIDKLKAALPAWSNYRHYVDDLIDLAEKTDRSSQSPWSLSRGHDLTEMLSLHFEAVGHKGFTRERLELQLRLACEFSTYSESPMAKQIVRGFASDFFAQP
jgi:hypothetical protein